MKDGLSISLVLLLAVVANAQTASFDEVRDVFGEAASQHEPFSAPCFQDWDSAECITIRTNYLSGCKSSILISSSASDIEPSGLSVQDKSSKLYGSDAVGDVPKKRRAVPSGRQ